MEYSFLGFLDVGIKLSVRKYLEGNAKLSLIQKKSSTKIGILISKSMQHVRLKKVSMYDALNFTAVNERNQPLTINGSFYFTLTPAIMKMYDKKAIVISLNIKKSKYRVFVTNKRNHKVLLKWGDNGKSHDAKKNFLKNEELIEPKTERKLIEVQYLTSPMNSPIQLYAYEADSKKPLQINDTEFIAVGANFSEPLEAHIGNEGTQDLDAYFYILNVTNQINKDVILRDKRRTVKYVIPAGKKHHLIKGGNVLEKDIAFQVFIRSSGSRALINGQKDILVTLSQMNSIRAINLTLSLRGVGLVYVYFNSINDNSAYLEWKEGISKKGIVVRPNAAPLLKRLAFPFNQRNINFRAYELSSGDRLFLNENLYVVSIRAPQSGVAVSNITVKSKVPYEHFFYRLKVNNMYNRDIVVKMKADNFSRDATIPSLTKERLIKTPVLYAGNLKAVEVTAFQIDSERRLTVNGNGSLFFYPSLDEIDFAVLDISGESISETVYFYILSVSTPPDLNVILKYKLGYEWHIVRVPKASSHYLVKLPYKSHKDPGSVIFRAYSEEDNKDLFVNDDIFVEIRASEDEAVSTNVDVSTVRRKSIFSAEIVNSIASKVILKWRYGNQSNSIIIDQNMHKKVVFDVNNSSERNLVLSANELSSQNSLLLNDSFTYLLKRNIRDFALVRLLITENVHTNCSFLITNQAATNVNLAFLSSDKSKRKIITIPFDSVNLLVSLPAVASESSKIKAVTDKIRINGKRSITCRPSTDNETMRALILTNSEKNQDFETIGTDHLIATFDTKDAFSYLTVTNPLKSDVLLTWNIFGISKEHIIHASSYNVSLPIAWNLPVQAAIISLKAKYKDSTKPLYVNGLEILKDVVNKDVDKSFNVVIGDTMVSAEFYFYTLGITNKVNTSVLVRYAINGERFKREVPPLSTQTISLQFAIGAPRNMVVEAQEKVSSKSLFVNNQTKEIFEKVASTPTAVITKYHMYKFYINLNVNSTSHQHSYIEWLLGSNENKHGEIVSPMSLHMVRLELLSSTQPSDVTFTARSIESDYKLILNDSSAISVSFSKSERETIYACLDIERLKLSILNTLPFAIDLQTRTLQKKKSLQIPAHLTKTIFVLPSTKLDIHTIVAFAIDLNLPVGINGSDEFIVPSLKLRQRNLTLLISQLPKVVYRLSIQNLRLNDVMLRWKINGLVNKTIVPSETKDFALRVTWASSKLSHITLSASHLNSNDTITLNSSSSLIAYPSKNSEDIYFVTIDPRKCSIHVNNPLLKNAIIHWFEGDIKIKKVVNGKTKMNFTVNLVGNDIKMYAKLQGTGDLLQMNLQNFIHVSNAVDDDGSIYVKLSKPLIQYFYNITLNNLHKNKVDLEWNQTSSKERSTILPYSVKTILFDVKSENLPPPVEFNAYDSALKTPLKINSSISTLVNASIHPTSIYFLIMNMSTIVVENPTVKKARIEWMVNKKRLEKIIPENSVQQIDLSSSLAEVKVSVRAFEHKSNMIMMLDGNPTLLIPSTVAGIVKLSTSHKRIFYYNLKVYNERLTKSKLIWKLNGQHESEIFPMKSISSDISIEIISKINPQPLLLKAIDDISKASVQINNTNSIEVKASPKRSAFTTVVLRDAPVALKILKMNVMNTLNVNAILNWMEQDKNVTKLIPAKSNGISILIQMKADVKDIILVAYTEKESKWLDINGKSKLNVAELSEMGETPYLLNLTLRLISHHCRVVFINKRLDDVMLYWNTVKGDGQRILKGNNTKTLVEVEIESSNKSAVLFNAVEQVHKQNVRLNDSNSVSVATTLDQAKLHYFVIPPKVVTLYVKNLLKSLVILKWNINGKLRKRYVPPKISNVKIDMIINTKKYHINAVSFRSKSSLQLNNRKFLTYRDLASAKDTLNVTISRNKRQVYCVVLVTNEVDGEVVLSWLVKGIKKHKVVPANAVNKRIKLVAVGKKEFTTDLEASHAVYKKSLQINSSDTVTVLFSKDLRRATWIRIEKRHVSVNVKNPLQNDVLIKWQENGKEVTKSIPPSSTSNEIMIPVPLNGENRVLVASVAETQDPIEMNGKKALTLPDFTSNDGVFVVSLSEPTVEYNYQLSITNRRSNDVLLKWSAGNGKREKLIPAKTIHRVVLVSLQTKDMPPPILFYGIDTSSEKHVYINSTKFLTVKGDGKVVYAMFDLDAADQQSYIVNVRNMLPFDVNFMHSFQRRHDTVFIKAGEQKRVVINSTACQKDCFPLLTASPVDQKKRFTLVLNKLTVMTLEQGLYEGDELNVNIGVKQHLNIRVSNVAGYNVRLEWMDSKGKRFADVPKDTRTYRLMIPYQETKIDHKSITFRAYAKNATFRVALNDVLDLSVDTTKIDGLFDIVMSDKGMCFVFYLVIVFIINFEKNKFRIKI